MGNPTLEPTHAVSAGVGQVRAPESAPPPSLIPRFDQLIPTRLPLVIFDVDRWGWKWDDATPRQVTAQIRQAWRDADRTPTVAIEMRDADGNVLVDQAGNPRIHTTIGDVTATGFEFVRTLGVCALIPDLSPRDAERLTAGQIDDIFRYLGYIKDGETEAPKVNTKTAPTVTTT